MSEFNSLTASELGDLIGKGEIDPVELTKYFISQIDLSPIGKKIYSTVTFLLAFEQAKDSKIRAKLGRRLSSLDGVPISWKDLFDIKGYPCEAGSELLAGRLANKNAKVYDFDYPNTKTQNNINFIDPIHYNDSIGKLIVEEIWNKKILFGK